MKNKDKYDLRKIMVKPKYNITGCGKKIVNKFWIDIYYDYELVAKDVEAKEHILPALMKWLEEEINGKQ